MQGGENFDDRSLAITIGEDVQSLSHHSISIAMATYNGEGFLEPQLESIARQTLRPIELVITDDGSTDATLEIAESFARTAPFPVRIFRNGSRLGYGDNFLKATSLCRGQLIAFSDQDDIWTDHKLRMCAKFFGDPLVVLAIHSALVFDDKGLRKEYYPRIARTRVLEPGSISAFVNSTADTARRPGFSMVIRKEALSLVDSENRPERLSGHDHWAWFLAASMGRIVMIEDVLTHYRHHETNVFGAPATRKPASPLTSNIGSLCLRIADCELACSGILSKAAEGAPSIWATSIMKSSRELAYFSQVHRRRAAMYEEKSTFLKRAGSFIHVLRSGGYLAHRIGFHLGVRALLRDVLFGVTGMYKTASD